MSDRLAGGLGKVRRTAAPRRSRNILLLSTIAAIAAAVGVSVVGGLAVDRMDDAAAVRIWEDRLAIGQLRSAVGDADNALLAYVLTSRVEFMNAYYQAEKPLEHREPAAVARLLPAAEDGPPTAEMLTSLREGWQIAIDLVRDDRPADAVTALRTAHVHEMHANLRRTMDSATERLQAADRARVGRSGTWKTILRATTLAGILIGGCVLVAAFRRIGQAISHGEAAGAQIEQLFVMGDMLQSAVDLNDTNAVLRAAAVRLMPGLSGALYVFNNSRDRLDLSTRWGYEGAGPCDHMAPTACWALKRGKPHLNDDGEAALRCAHSESGLITLDIPMTARGQLHGLLEIATDGPYARQRLEAAQPIATAIADAMSLALSNAALRDQLRNQALKDSLTGLYNRRFLEEVHERLCLDSVRRGSSIGLVMLDLDHFKRLNDTFGHGAGDVVLREVATTILACIRHSDIACRYGGEELLVLLPDCDLDIAAGKAEQIRQRIASLTFAGGISVTASFGVAALPDSSSGPAALLADADAALYRAKTGGRDRVMRAPSRAAQDALPLVLPEAA